MNLGQKEMVKESMSVLDCLGYDVSGKDYKTWMNITYETSNNIISNGG
jgi:hypothetical protein